MNVPEREDLKLVLRALDAQDQVLGEIRKDMRDLSARVQAMELKDMTAVTVASTTATLAAASAARSQRRQLTVRAWIALGITAVGAAVTAAISIYQFIHPT